MAWKRTLSVGLNVTTDQLDCLSRLQTSREGTHSKLRRRSKAPGGDTQVAIEQHKTLSISPSRVATLVRMEKHKGFMNHYLLGLEKGNNGIIIDISFIATAYCTPPGTDTMQVIALWMCSFYPGLMFCSKMIFAVARYASRWALVQFRMFSTGSWWRRLVGDIAAFRAREHCLRILLCHFQQLLPGLFKIVAM